MSNLIIIIGRGHSGTRLIAQTLLESGVYMGLAVNDSYDVIPPAPLYQVAWLAARHVKYSGDLKWDFNELLETEPPEAARLWRDISLSDVIYSERPFAGWKLPETLLALPWWVKWFPDARYIHWVRDPRDVALGGHLTDDLRDFGVPGPVCDTLLDRRIASILYQHQIIRATPKPKRWQVFRFEDFIERQDEELETLREFLEFPLTMKKVEVRSESIGRWHEMPEEDKVKLEPLAGIVKMYGYD